MPSETTIKGEIACLKVEQRAIEKGAIVSRPSIECPYDRVVDWNGKLQRVQIKYGNGKLTRSTGSFVARLDRISHDPSKRKTYGADEIDAVLVYSPTTDKVYWFDPSHWVGKTHLTVRYEATKNNQTKGCLMADTVEW